jgi:iron-sulfur cluster insertion protein
MSDTATITDRPAVELSDSAARRIAKLAAAEGPGVRFRIAISGGGCSGFQYGFSFDDALTGEDLVFAKDGAELVIDETSLDLMRGAVVDFIEDLSGSYFQIRNPQAASSCGCGTSFSPV